MPQRRRATSAETARARQLRADSSQPESLLWFSLRNRSVAGLKFRRQLLLGSYVVDFICLESRLVVELDGEKSSEKGTATAGGASPLFGATQSTSGRVPRSALLLRRLRSSGMVA